MVLKIKTTLDLKHYPANDLAHAVLKALGLSRKQFSDDDLQRLQNSLCLELGIVIENQTGPMNFGDDPQTTDLDINI